MPAPEGPTSAVIAVRGSSSQTSFRMTVPARSCRTARSAKRGGTWRRSRILSASQYVVSAPSQHLVPLDRDATVVRLRNTILMLGATSLALFAVTGTRNALSARTIHCHANADTNPETEPCRPNNTTSHRTSFPNRRVPSPA